MPPAPERAKGSVTYRFATPYDPKANILYVNVVPRYQCVNSCRFCSRSHAIEGLPNIYEQKAGANLYLPRAPSAREVVDRVMAERQKITEIAFVGLGEPLLQFKTVRDAIRGIRTSGYRGKIRIDTNGLAKNWAGNPARELKQAGLDEIRISVNATSGDEYDRLCRPKFPNAFESLRGFVQDCVREGIDTKASFVTKFRDEAARSRTPREYRAFARSLGIKPRNVVLREYVKPIVRPSTARRVP